MRVILSIPFATLLQGIGSRGCQSTSAARV